MNVLCKFYYLWIRNQNLFILDLFYINLIFYIYIFLCVCVCVSVCVCVFVCVCVCLCLCLCGWVSGMVCFLCVCLCMFLLVFVCVCLVCDFYFGCICPVFFLCLRFSKMIRVIHRYYLSKNACEREESLLGILSLESDTSFSCNQKSKISSLSLCLLL